MPGFGLLSPFGTSSMMDVVNKDNMQSVGIPCNISEDENKYIVSADLPGFDKKDIKCEFCTQKNALEISAEHTDEKEEKGANFHRMERSSRSRYRNIVFPLGCDANAIEAKAENGVLNIEILKTPEGKAAGKQRVAIG